jgi:hypothetical protein
MIEKPGLTPNLAVSVIPAKAQNKRIQSALLPAEAEIKPRLRRVSR